MESLNPLDRKHADFTISPDSPAGAIGTVAYYGAKICGPWEQFFKEKAAEAKMSVSYYIQSKVEERFSLETQKELAASFGVTLAHQRRELFMHVWPDLPKWNVFSKRVLVNANSPKRGRKTGAKSTYHKPECVDEPPMRNAYNDVMLDPEDYITLREIAESKNITPQQVLRTLAHKACANYRAAKAAEQAEDL